jgi:hypothetical protein
MTEGPAMTFRRLSPGVWEVRSPSGTTYHVSQGGCCSCPDSLFRAGPAQTPCKHRIALALHLLATGQV